MEMTRERISFIFDPRHMLLSLQTGFGFVRAAVASSIVERISGLVPHLKQLLRGIRSLLRYPASALLS